MRPASGTLSGAVAQAGGFDRVRIRNERGQDNPNCSRNYNALIEMSGLNAHGDGTVQAGAGTRSGQMAVPIDDRFEHQGAFDSLSICDHTIA